jgi:23S rRNA (cytidine1920-2'-O)/16S rRNA (cytidine1409-2'-O)-methyltransferase
VSQTLVSRGGRKLAAALERFGLAGAVRGAQAIDVGASTGGFTEVLLDAGAAAVTAVDVGHGQLHPRLRGDARVTVLEKTDFKTLSLHVAPGPFDFFVVDVSFVAARNMLRGLAFRLRPGARGVVLVKPQFELPARAAAGDLGDPALRARALDSFRRKAERLGFRLREHVDSPVPGGEGTVEILTHLERRGRRGRRRRAGDRRAVTGNWRPVFCAGSPWRRPGWRTWYGTRRRGWRG